MNALEAMARFQKAVIPQDGSETYDFNAAVDRAINSLPVRTRNENFWPSSINSPFECDRKLALSRIEKVWTDQMREPPEKLRVMNVGTAIHAYVQDHYLARGARIYGNWICPHCRQVAATNSLRPGSYCPNEVTVQLPEDTIALMEKKETRITRKCATWQKRRAEWGDPIWEYGELRVKHPTLLISGKVDGVLIGEDGKWWPIELKTLEDAAFNDLQRVKATKRMFPNLPDEMVGQEVLIPARDKLPRGYHVNQGSIYSELMIEHAADYGLDPAKYQGTFILYVNRGNLQMKSFIRRNSATAFNAARGTIENIQSIVALTDQERKTDPKAEQDRIEKNRAIGMRIGPSCKTRTDRKAVLCPWQTICFPYKVKTKLHLNKVNAMTV